MRKIRWNLIRSLILIFIRSLIPIPIQFRHISPFHPPSPLLVANPGGGGHKHLQPGTSPGLHRRCSRLLIPLYLPLRHLVGAIVFIVDIPQIGVGGSQRRNLTPPSIPSRRHHPPPFHPTYPLILGLDALPHSPFLPPPPPYVPINYHATPRAAVSSLLPAPVDKDEDEGEEDNPRRTSI